MAELAQAWDASRFDPQSPSWCPEVQRWTDIRPRDTSWGYVIDPLAELPVRQHVCSDDWIVRFADGHLQVMTPEQFELFHRPTGLNSEAATA